MTTFTTEDRLNALPASSEPIPFAGWVENMDDIVALLRDQIHAMQSEINRLNQYIKDLEAKVYGGNTK
jgi:hypothetical protein